MIHAVLAALLAAGFFCLPAAARKKTSVDVGLSFFVDASGYPSTRRRCSFSASAMPAI